jgi:hypothetical protein
MKFANNRFIVIWTPQRILISLLIWFWRMCCFPKQKKVSKFELSYGDMSYFHILIGTQHLRNRIRFWETLLYLLFLLASDFFIWVKSPSNEKLQN